MQTDRNTSHPDPNGKDHTDTPGNDCPDTTQRR